jgi:hypothetical protein
LKNILKTFEKLKGDPDRLNQSIELLTLMLASESCGGKII